MKKPMAPPKYDFNQLTATHFFDSNFFKNSFSAESGFNPTTDKGEYLHWDKLRYIKTPDAISAEQWWFAIKLARKSLYKYLQFTDNNHRAFVLATPDIVLYKLHSIDRNTGNAIQGPAATLNTNMRDTYLTQSLMEEAIASSQFEGASITRRVAKDMLRTKRKPRNLSEKMIYNNYQAMQFIRGIKNEALTPEIILELHRILTKDTLENPDTAGCLRTTDDVHVYDNTNQILHTPPKAAELKTRLATLCQFANAHKDQKNFFIHPVIRAILLHFMLAYDHPFVDGNGRTARALFYWSMAHQNYWLMEFISISEILKKSPSDYARAYLYTETDDNDVTYFVIHQLDIILQAINSLYEYIEKQSKDISETEQLLYTNKFLQNKLNYRQIALIKHALKHPNMHYQIESHRQSHNVTYDTARTDLLNLAKFNLLLKQKTGKAFTFIAPSDLRKRIEDIER